MSYLETPRQNRHLFKALPLSMMMAVAIGSAVITVPSQVHAETSQASTQAFNIAAGPLDQVLNRFALAANIDLSVNSQITANKRSNGLVASVDVQTGLQRLLSSHGLVAIKTSATSYTVKQVTDGSEAGVDLPVVNIDADGVSETATSPVDGYLATRSASATKTDTPLIETPRSVTVVTADQIKDRKVQTVEDAVAYVSGVRIGNSGYDPRFDQITIRGFDVTTDADYRDGLRQSNSGWLSYLRTEPYGLERIDVVKGPDSVLFGQISPGGLVNRVSKRPTAEAIHEVEVQAGSDDHYQGQFDFAGKVGETDEWTYRVVGLARKSRSDIVGVIDDNLYFAPSLTWRPNDDTSLTLLAQRQRYETAGSPRPFAIDGEHVTDFWGGDVDFDKLLQTQTSVGYEFEHRFNDTFTLRQNARYSYVDTTNQYADGTLNADGHTLDRTAYGVYEDMHNLVMDTSLESQFSTAMLSHKLLTGLDYYQVNSRVRYAYGDAPTIDMLNPDYRQSISRPSTLISNDKNEGEQVGLYVQDQIALNNWRLSLGLRHDKVEKETHDYLAQTRTSLDDQQTTGSAGLLYAFDNGISPYISYATSYIATFSSNVNGNQYKPTEGEQWEVGIKYKPVGLDSFFTASVFDLTQQNVLTQDPNDINNQIQKGEKQVRGLELEANTQWESGLQLVASYTYQSAKVTKSNDGDEGKQFVGIPRHMASLWTNYPMTTDWKVGGGVRWVGESYSTSDNTQKNGAYTIVDARTSYDLTQWVRGATVAINATNLFNNEYDTCEYGYCYRGIGRKVIASFNYNW